VPSQKVGLSASVNLPLHHKVQKFSSGNSSPGWSQKKGCKTVVVVTMMYLRVNRRVRMACNFNCLTKTEGVFKVTGSNVHHMVQDRDVVTTDN